MSRTGGGEIFRCKVCGEYHILTKGELHDGIRVPCGWNRKEIRSYNKADFKFYYGYVDLIDLVEEAV